MMLNKPIRGTTVIVREGDDIGRALRKLKNKVEDAGTLKALQRKEAYEKPTTERKRKKAAAKARYQKQLAREHLPPKLF